MPWKDNVGLQVVGAVHGGVEVLDLEPQQNAITVRLIVGIRDRSMMVFSLERMQLKDQDVASNSPLIHRSTVCALTAEEALIPPAASFDITDDDQRLRSHH